jgi:hypothetical protein
VPERTADRLIDLSFEDRKRHFADGLRSATVGLRQRRWKNCNKTNENGTSGGGGYEMNSPKRLRGWRQCGRDCCRLMKGKVVTSLDQRVQRLEQDRIASAPAKLTELWQGRIAEMAAVADHPLIGKDGRVKIGELVERCETALKRFQESEVVERWRECFEVLLHEREYLDHLRRVCFDAPSAHRTPRN